MRVLIVGEDHPWSSEVGYARQFRRKNCHVEIWNNKRPRLFFGNRNWWHMGRGTKAIYDAISSIAFLHKNTAWKPHVIFMPKAENIHSRAVKIAKQRTGAKLITWYPDHPFKADMTSMNILRNLPRYDNFYIWGHFLKESIRAAGAKHVEYLPFAFDPSAHPSEITISANERLKYSCEICFVGAWDAERENDLGALCDFDLAIWGPGWRENISKSSPLLSKIRGGGLFNDELVKAYRCSSVVFNHLRKHNGSAHNMRAMEIAGIGGGIQLVRRTPELAVELFKEGEHLLCYESDVEMREQARKAIHDSKSGSNMRFAARDRVLSDHLLEYRINRILADLGA